MNSEKKPNDYSIILNMTASSKLKILRYLALGYDVYKHDPMYAMNPIEIQVSENILSDRQILDKHFIPEELNVDNKNLIGIFGLKF